MTNLSETFWNDITSSGIYRANGDQFCELSVFTGYEENTLYKTYVKFGADDFELDFTKFHVCHVKLPHVR